VQVRKRRSAGCYFTILGKMKIVENEEQRYGMAGHVGQLSFHLSLVVLVCYRSLANI
jgi:hypothetical protein